MRPPSSSTSSSEAREAPGAPAHGRAHEAGWAPAGGAPVAVPVVDPPAGPPDPRGDSGGRGAPLPRAPAPVASPPRTWRDGAKALAWTLAFLLLIDVAINRLFRYPADPARPPTRMQAYFEYGRTLEGKLPRLVGPTDETTAPVSKAGWLQGTAALAVPARVPGKLNVRVYGMSFSDHVAYAAARRDAGLHVTVFDGPAAPPNHSFAGYTLERGKLDADAVVLGVLASSVPKMPTLTMMTATYEAPTVYTYPRYRLDGDELRATWPSVLSLADFRATLADSKKWDAYLGELAANDAYYSALLTRAMPLDHSALARMGWRALAQRHQRGLDERYHTVDGFVEDADTLGVLRAMVREFAVTARADGRRPVVLLLNDQGYGDHLYKALAGVLERDKIPYVSSHTIAPATDHRNFIADGHFTPENDDRLGQALVDVLRAK